ncbi:ion transporter [Polyangium jinanense]|uniref:Ion transport domain-containing protein n=1 Tax=Polyangium jinanense TaxID=2829994 RepID=A0A9X4ASX7_9BACT|nr:ion transporter [Polyangium jinanense]MDC3958153.1 hypothetical protein [Polyangium jinanense]MDC3983648.1 hypothetical protein [Polyangium jinanense]
MAPRAPSLPRRVAALLDKRPVKIGLAICILVSLLPMPRLESALRPVFLAIFTIELALRFLALRRPREEIRRFEWFFLVVDLLALLSFLPFEQIGDPRYVAPLLSLRLARLLLLLRFARELAADLYSIVTRREQLQQFGLVTVAVWSLAFGAAVVLDHLAIRYDYTGSGLAADADFIDRVWWAFRQLESADNLVGTIKVPAPIAVLSLGLTIVGVFVVSFIIGIGSNVVDQVVRAERRRTVDYDEHSLVIGPVHEAEMLVREFARLYERNRILRSFFRPAEILQWLRGRGAMPRRHALPRMALLGTTEAPPGYLYEPMMRWVMYREGDGWDPDALARVSAATAKRAILLSRADAGPDADAVTTMTLASFRAQNQDAQVFVEVVESENRALVMAIGGPHTFPLDMPRFLGLFLCQHLVTPGVEALYTDLMTADGSEFYTHMFVEPGEAEAIEALGGEDGFVSFERLARAAYEERGVLLTGVFLGKATPRRTRGLVPVADLEQWLNPLRDPEEGSGAWKLGARAGKIPTKLLRGIIGVTATYAPLRRYGRDLVMGRGITPVSQQTTPPRAEICTWAEDTHMARGLLSRVLVVGYSPALPSMVRELARFMPGVDATLVLGERGDERMPLAMRLASLGIGIERDVPPPGREGVTMSLEHGGRVTVYTQRGHDLASFAVECAKKGGPIGAVIFLSEPDAVDRDARTTMRLLRFVGALERGELARGERLHVLAEFASVQKGEHARRLVDAERCGFASGRLRLSLVSTDRIKNYFMVHSAFVPGVTALYDEILGEYGQEIVRLEPGEHAAGAKGTVRFDELREALASRQVIPIAIERRAVDEHARERLEVLLNPPRDRVFALSEIVALYALAESRDLEEPAARVARERAPASRTVGPFGVDMGA